MGIDEIWENIKETLTEEELTNLIIEEQRRRQSVEQDRRPELQIPLYPPEPYPYPEEEPEDEQRGVIIIDI